MKKNIITAVMILCAAAAWSQTGTQDFTGSWSLAPSVVEMDGELLLTPEADYAFPYLGITEIDFLDSGFILFHAGDDVFRAFYEIETLDYDNFHINCRLTNDELFLLKFVRHDEGWKFLYRIDEGSILNGTDIEAETDTEKDAEADTEAEVDTEAEAEELPVFSTYIGIITRK